MVSFFMPVLLLLESLGGGWVCLILRDAFSHYSIVAFHLLSISFTLCNIAPVLGLGPPPRASRKGSSHRASPHSAPLPDCSSSWEVKSGQSLAIPQAEISFPPSIGHESATAAFDLPGGLTLDRSHRSTVECRRGAACYPLRCASRKSRTRLTFGDASNCGSPCPAAFRTSIVTRSAPHAARSFAARSRDC